MRKQISQKANPTIDLNQYFAKFINWDSLTMYRRKNTCDLLLRTTFLHYHATCWKSIILRQDFFFFNLYFLLFSISLFIRMYLNHLPLYQPWIFWNFDCSLQWIWSNLIRNVWTFLHLDIKPLFFPQRAFWVGCLMRWGNLCSWGVWGPGWADATGSSVGATGIAHL